MQQVQKSYEEIGNTRSCIPENLKTQSVFEIIVTVHFRLQILSKPLSFCQRNFVTPWNINVFN